MDLNEKLVKSIQSIGQRYPVKKIVLFGSRARGDNRAVSDIDLAIFPLPEFSLRGHIASDIDDLQTLFKIDIVFIDEGVDPILLKNIEREGVILYERTIH